MNRRWVIFGLVLVAAATLCAQVPRQRQQLRNKNAEYNCRVGGYVTGPGTAAVGGGKVSISATGLKADDGSTGDLTVDGLALTKDNHFSGPGTVLGQTVDFEGRIDQPDDLKEHAIKGVRLSATFKNAQGQYGRVVGWVQSYADGPAPSDDDKTPPPPTTRPSRPRTGGGTQPPPNVPPDDERLERERNRPQARH